MKLFLLIFAFLITGFVNISGQNMNFRKVSNKAESIQKLLTSGTSLKSMSCDFVQQKELSILSETVISEGAFYLMGNNKLVWEYKSPYQYKIVINRDKMLVDNSNTKMTFDTRSNRIFKEISNIMIKSIDGSIVNDNLTFGTELFENNSELMASLKPKTKELGMLFKQINLYFKKSNYLVYKIEMLEEQGDKTIINLKNHKLNENIENKVFNIDN